MTGRNDYWDRERECERFFMERGPFYYITTENLDWMLYESKEEFAVGTNIVAVSSARSGFIVMDDTQMNNHHHIMGAGTLVQANVFVEILHNLERKYQKNMGKPSLKEWSIRIDPVQDIKDFRNKIAYTDRNAYVARLDSTPTGYPWGSAYLFFNGNLWQMKAGTPFREVGGREKRRICRSHEVDMPEHYKVCDGMILRSSFVDYHATEYLFNSANQYFTMLTRRGESDVEIAAILGEHIQIPNEEVFQIVASWNPGKQLTALSLEEKLRTAQKMKQRLASSNRQISLILRLSATEVDRLFPKPQ